MLETIYLLQRFVSGCAHPRGYMLRVVVLGLRKPLRALPAAGNVANFQKPQVCTSKLSVLAAKRLEANTVSKEEDQVSSLYCTK